MHGIALFLRRFAWLAAGVLLGIGLPAMPAAFGQETEANVMLSEVFADGEAALQRWEFRGDEKAKLTFVPAQEGAAAKAAYVDFRERASWSLLSRREIRLEAGAQYTLSARVRRNLGYGAIRLVARGAGEANLAEVDVIRRENERHQVSVVFVARGDAAVRVGFAAGGYAELWIEEITLRRNVPPLSSYVTGLLLPASSPTTQARYRTGAFLEAEEIVAARDAVTGEDKDGDGRWALCRVDPDANPWLFSENTVLKSDSLSREEGGRTPSLKLTVEKLLPGPYQAFLSDPYRDAAVSLDGEEWRRVKGAAGEVDLGVVDVDGAFSVWVSHAYRTAGNPGPIYVDYVRLMPVYDAGKGLERPAPLPPVAEPPPVQRTTLRISGGAPRFQEWVTAGIPFARGAFRPGDGIQVEGASDLVTRPLVLWRDGSVKWLRAEFRADVDGKADAGRVVRYGRGVPAQPLPGSATAGSAARQVAAGHSLRCGRIEVVAGKSLWENLLLDGREILSGEPAVRLATASGPRLDQLLVESAAIENDGPHHTLLVRGHLGASGKPGPIAFEARLTETAPETLRLYFSVVNESDERYQPEKGCGPAMPLTELALVLDGIRFVPKTIRWPGAGALPLDGERQTLLQTGTGTCVEDFAGSWQLTVGERIVASGKSTPGWVELRGAGAGVAVGVREFLEKCPKSLAVRRSGDGTAVEIGVWPAEAKGTLRWAQGTRLATEIALVLHDGTQPEAETGSRLASVLQPLRAVLPPEYLCSTGVFGPVSPVKDERFAGFYAGAEATFRALRSRAMSYGIEHWGDFFAPCGYVRTDARLWTNMEWDLIAALMTEYARTGDDAYLECAHQAARHFAHIDTIHFSSNEKWRGGSHVHTGDTREGHQVEPPDYAHAGWAQGLLWAYYACGDESLRDAAVGLADYVVNNLPPEGPYRSQPPFSMWNCSRQAGNPILTLAAVCELDPEPKRLHALHRIVDFALRAQDPKLGCWSAPFYEEPVYHRPSPHWGAVLERGLHAYWQLTGDRRVEDAFRRLGAFFLERHPPETRRDLRPGSYYRSTFVFEAEPIAWASLFSRDPDPLLERGLGHLEKAFPPGRAGVSGARGAPGDLMGGALLTGALARAKEDRR